MNNSGKGTFIQKHGNLKKWNSYPFVNWLRRKGVKIVDIETKKNGIYEFRCPNLSEFEIRQLYEEYIGLAKLKRNIRIVNEKLFLGKYSHLSEQEIRKRSFFKYLMDNNIKIIIDEDSNVYCQNTSLFEIQNLCIKYIKISNAKLVLGFTDCEVLPDGFEDIKNGAQDFSRLLFQGIDENPSQHIEIMNFTVEYDVFNKKNAVCVDCSTFSVTNTLEYINKCFLCELCKHRELQYYEFEPFLLTKEEVDSKIYDAFPDTEYSKILKYIPFQPKNKLGLLQPIKKRTVFSFVSFIASLDYSWEVNVKYGRKSRALQLFCINIMYEYLRDYTLETFSKEQKEEIYELLSPMKSNIKFDGHFSSSLRSIVKQKIDNSLTIEKNKKDSKGTSQEKLLELKRQKEELENLLKNVNREIASLEKTKIDDLMEEKIKVLNYSK